MINREATVMDIQARKMRFDALSLLGKMGLKTLKMKLFVGGLICLGTTIALSYLAAYGTVRGEVGALLQSQQTIDQFARLALLLNAGILAFMGMIIFLLSKNISEALAPALVEGSGGGAIAASIFGSQEESRQELDESRRTNARLTAILNSLPQSIFCKDLAGAYVFSNKAFCARLGMSPEMIIGNNDSGFLTPDLAEQRAVEDRQIVETGQPVESVLNELGPDSGEVYLQLIRTPTFDDAGEIVGVQGIFFDVTKSKLAEAALEQERTLLRALMDNTPDFVYFKDNASRFLRINKAHAAWFGLKDPSQAIGKADFDFFTGEHAQQAYEDEQRIISTGQPLVGVEEKETWADREDTWVSTTKSPLYGLDQRIIGTFGITRDITERKRVEQTLERNLSEFLTFVSQVSRGDLTIRNKEGEDTLGLVAQSINKMLDNFSAMLTQVKQLGLSISSSTTQILVAAEQIEEGTQRQTDETTNVTSSVEEMAASMALVSQHAAGSVEAARRALVAAEQGGASVRDTSLAMNRIAAAVDRAADKMRMLVKRSSEISEIINLISDVAAQTNLLSLNAAIQAAHAGEAGLGFSVVAEEIRKLAERSAHSTKDVSHLIKTIQDETAEALEAMENGLTEVKNGGSVADKSKQALQDISVVVTQSAALIEEISAASDEQARVTHRLASAMQEISSVTIEASAGARETSAIIQGLARLSERLNESISQFKIVTPESDGRSA